MANPLPIDNPPSTDELAVSIASTIDTETPEPPASEAMGIALTSTGKCNGYINTSPDHRLTLTTNFDYLSVAAVTEGYASLVITGPNAEVWCATNQNPGISGFYEQGIYDIYISNLRQGTGPRYELMITELR